MIVSLMTDHDLDFFATHCCLVTCMCPLLCSFVHIFHFTSKRVEIQNLNSLIIPQICKRKGIESNLANGK